MKIENSNVKFVRRDYSCIYSVSNIFDKALISVEMSQLCSTHSLRQELWQL